MIGRKSKKNVDRKSSTSLYKKQQSYHYSAQRSQSDRAFDRHNVGDQTAPSRSKKLQSLPGLAGVFLVIAGLFYLTTLSGNAQIEVRNSSEFIGDQSAVAIKANEYLHQSILHRSKIFLDEEDMALYLKKAFPEFSDVSVQTYIVRHRPVIAITFGKPSLRITNGTNVFIVSDNGTILLDISKTKPTFDTSNLPLVQDQSSLVLTVGKAAITKDQVLYIQQLSYQAKQKNTAIETLLLNSGGGELDVRYASQKYLVKYNLFEDARKSSGVYFAAREQLEKTGPLPVDYIDVRIPERAYIK